MTRQRRKRTGTRRGRRLSARRGRWLQRSGIVLLVAAPVLLGAATLAYRSLSRQIDTRLAQGWTTPPTVVLAAPVELTPGRVFSHDDIATSLRDLGYLERDRPRRSGEYSFEPDGILLIQQHGPDRGRTVRVRFTQVANDATRIAGIEVPPDGHTDHLSLGAPYLSTLHGRDRQRRRITPLTAMPRTVIEAVLAAEDHRFFAHPGIDGVRIAGAALANLSGRRRYLEGASTLTQQLVKNTLLTPKQTVWRKLREQALALLLERQVSKRRILEMYLNDVYLGHRGTFAIHGVTQGSRELFGKELGALTLGDAATMAGMIRAPQTHAPDRYPDRALTRRNSVLHTMVALGIISPDRAMVATREPLSTTPRSRDREAPYFVDFVREELGTRGRNLDTPPRDLVVESTIDLHLQRVAEAVVRDGLRALKSHPAGRETPSPQAALIAVEPATGAIRAMVGGGSYQGSQFNRVDRARRQPGSIIKPFVYLAALARGHRAPTSAFTVASVLADRPTTFVLNGRAWRPRNFGGVYAGPITSRRALSSSHNVAAVTVAKRAGFGAIADLWANASGGTRPPVYPSIALGGFDTTPLEVASAYAVLANQGLFVPLRAITRARVADAALELRDDAPRRVVSAEAAFIVTSLLRSTFETGTAAHVRRQGFRTGASGKTGTTNELRDAWFAGYTPGLVAVVWVGRDDGQPLGLTGAEAALPIWTAFMSRALGRELEVPSAVPPGITFVNIDPHTGLIATPQCPIAVREPFIKGTEPHTSCRAH